MTSKLERAMDFLELLPDATTLDIIEVSKKVKCSERWVWEAKKRLELKYQENSEKFSLLKELSSDLKKITSLLVDLSQNPRKLTTNEVRELNRIGENILKIDKKIKELETKYGS